MQSVARCLISGKSLKPASTPALDRLRASFEIHERTDSDKLKLTVSPNHANVFGVAVEEKVEIVTFRTRFGNEMTPDSTQPSRCSAAASFMPMATGKCPGPEFQPEIALGATHRATTR